MQMHMTSLKYDCAQSAVRSVVLNLRVRVSGKHVVCAAAVTDAGGKRPVAGAERHDFVQNKPVTHVGKTEQYITDIIRIIAQIVRPGRIAVIALVRADIELAAVLLGRAQNRAHVRRRHAERHGAKLRLQGDCCKARSTFAASLFPAASVPAAPDSRFSAAGSSAGASSASAGASSAAVSSVICGASDFASVVEVVLSSIMLAVSGAELSVLPQEAADGSQDRSPARSTRPAPPT